MNKSLDISEIIHLAMLNEEKGARFYKWMANKTNSRNTKEIFNKLAQEEMEHYRFFASLADQDMMSKTIEQGAIFYLKAILESNVFPVEIDGEVNIKSPKDAFSIGIQAEKDSILLYQELYNCTTSEKTRKILSELLQEEKMHLVELRQQIEELR